MAPTPPCNLRYGYLHCCFNDVFFYALTAPLSTSMQKIACTPYFPSFSTTGQDTPNCKWVACSCGGVLRNWEMRFQSMGKTSDQTFSNLALKMLTEGADGIQELIPIFRNPRQKMPTLCFGGGMYLGVSCRAFLDRKLIAIV